MGRIIVFDVNETLSDIARLDDVFATAGVSRALAATWFAATLREGFALTAAGSFATFAEIGKEVAINLLTDVVANASEAADEILRNFLDLPTHPDVAPGVSALRSQGHELSTLSNGSAHVAERLLSRAGIRNNFIQLLSIDDVGAWKPDRRAYDYAVRAHDAKPSDLTMVAVHPWDLHGAARAGLNTVWINRENRRFPAYLQPPDLEVETLTDLA